MSENVKLTLMNIALDIARETMFAKRQYEENTWEQSERKGDYPSIPSIDIKELTAVYDILVKTYNSSSINKT